MLSQKPSTRVLMYFFGLIYINLDGSLFMRKIEHCCYVCVLFRWNYYYRSLRKRDMGALTGSILTRDFFILIPGHANKFKYFLQVRF